MFFDCYFECYNDCTSEATQSKFENVLLADACEYEIGISWSLRIRVRVRECDVLALFGSFAMFFAVIGFL